MSDRERPPLHVLTCEQIDILLHKVDEQHWPSITAMRVKSFYPPDTPVPPQAPEHLRRQIDWYASSLFKTEAEQYEQFRSDARYGMWLASLADRIRERVLKNLEILENSDTGALHNLMGVRGGLILGYHGLTTQEVEKGLRTLLLEICGQYERGIAPSQSDTVDAICPLPQAQSETHGAAESISEQIKRLKDECDITAEEIAEVLGVVPRSIWKHLAGTTVPRRGHLAAYERLFSDRLKRSVTFQKVSKKS